MPTDEADDARIRRTIKRINQALEVKQLIAEFHKNRLVPSTEKIFRNAKRKSNE
jgi:GH15 family glucan-1,4-alpha-glucosidase